MCNTVLPATPAKNIRAMSVLPGVDQFGQPDPKQTKAVEATVQVTLDLCDACKGKVLSHLVTAEAYAESKIHRFGEKK
jgi:hypothetical protein